MRRDYDVLIIAALTFGLSLGPSACDGNVTLP